MTAPLRVALFYRPTWYRKARVDGQFAYEVPEMRWTTFHLDKFFRETLNKVQCFDFAYWDEGKYSPYSRFLPKKGTHPIPLVMNVIYPTLSASIYNSRLERAQQQADLVLLDHDRLDRWVGKCACPVRRLAYSVNEHYYRPLEKDIDVGFYCVWHYNPERPPMHDWLADFCKRKGYSYASNEGLMLEEGYPELLGRTKVVVHINRTIYTRPPRIFDVAAAGGALLSSPMPEVSGEEWIVGEHYVKFDRPKAPKAVSASPHADGRTYTDQQCEEVAAGLECLLDEGHWEEIAANARAYVLEHHTWATRAKELEAIYWDVFKDWGRPCLN